MSCLNCNNYSCSGGCQGVLGQGMVTNIGSTTHIPNLQGTGTFQINPGMPPIYTNQGPVYYPGFITNQAIGTMANGYLPYVQPIASTADDFLDTISDKDDTNSCISFLEKQKNVKKYFQDEIEKIMKQMQLNLDSLENEFIAKCAKYRPTISQELLNKIKKLKHFM